MADMSGWDQPPSPGLIDLSLPVRDGAPSFPGDPRCSIVPFRTIPPDSLTLHTVTMGTHQGTHLDAPLHFIEGGRPVDQVALGQTIGEAILVDLRHKADRSTIEVSDLDGLDLAPGDRLVYQLGWDQRLVDPASYFTDMPRLGLDTARWLATKRLGLVGMDAPTPNPDAFVEVHQVILGAGTVMLEALANLDALRPGRFWLHAAPVRLENLDGAPVRAVASQEPAPG